ncbi:GIY-YIG nuclease family protein [Halobacteriovorax sp. GB3]|uniref:GIY-YIG nuclease family protein n=1 Tax=Halobacteriovorax sp. GB3 TaxID=2719615 RepID=UPI00235EC38A|nr:GIY-YIG nuclease family protein [Halobacteriovorax sp. GB3]MDD0851814.1 GIY-YIG nuclease family protein [Halobacteriovorax sp. GB3]
MWYIYMIRTTKNKLYTGITTDVLRRFNEHKSGKKGARFFRSNTPKEIVYVEESENRSSASKREYEIKTFTKSQKERLVKSELNLVELFQ